MLPHTTATIDCDEIVDWPSFHRTFKEVMGFPDFYGCNMDAWIDCLTSLDDPEDGMTTIHAPPNGCVVLVLRNVKSFTERCPEQYAAIQDCAAFVNWRRLEIDEPPVLMLSFNK